MIAATGGKDPTVYCYKIKRFKRKHVAPRVRAVTLEAP